MIMKKSNLLIIYTLVLCCLFAGCKKDATTKKEPDITQICSICNLATLECYYHNVAKSTKPKSNWMQKDRKFWIEYTGVAKIGIDMSKVNMELDTDTVTVSIPEAELLSINILENDLNKNSYISNEDSALVKNPITADDQIKAINTAQKHMEDSVKSNNALLVNAQEQAKKSIKNYINKMGEITDTKYKVKWKYIKSDKTEKEKQ